MSSAPSALSLVAAGLYALASLSCLRAAFLASVSGQRSWHTFGWFVLVGLFIALVGLRLFNLEEVFRTELRSLVRVQEGYADRREWQSALIAVIAGISAIAAFFGFYRASKIVRGRRDAVIAIALGGAAMMLLLILVRLVSLHSVDQLLYGPLKINWVADLGLSASIFSLSIYYGFLIRNFSRRIS